MIALFVPYRILSSCNLIAEKIYCFSSCITLSIFIRGKDIVSLYMQRELKNSTSCSDIERALLILKIEKPLYVYQENGTYTEEILKIYHKI